MPEGQLVLHIILFNKKQTAAQRSDTVSLLWDVGVHQLAPSQNNRSAWNKNKTRCGRCACNRTTENRLSWLTRHHVCPKVKTELWVCSLQGWLSLPESEESSPHYLLSFQSASPSLGTTAWCWYSCWSQEMGNIWDTEMQLSHQSSPGGSLQSHSSKVGR